MVMSKGWKWRKWQSVEKKVARFLFHVLKLMWRCWILTSRINSYGSTLLWCVAADLNSGGLFFLICNCFLILTIRCSFRSHYTIAIQIWQEHTCAMTSGFNSAILLTCMHAYLLSFLWYFSERGPRKKMPNSSCIKVCHIYVCFFYF